MSCGISPTCTKLGDARSPGRPLPSAYTKPRHEAAGVDHIDTAQYYGPGVVNDLIREALYPYPDGLAIVSEVAVRRATMAPSSRSTSREPDPADGRFTNAILTDQGLQTLADAAPGHVAHVRSLVIDVLSPEQLRRMGLAADRIMSRIDTFEIN